jgi:hypothetical protein
MQQEQPQQQNDFRQAVNVCFAIANAHAACITPFIRHSFGSNYPGICGLFAVILMFFTAAESRDPRMLDYLAIWMVVVVLQRIRSFALRRRGLSVHSYYAGLPWLAMLVPFSKTENQAKNFEPILCLVIGGFVGIWSPTVGGFVMAGFVSLTVIQGMQAEMRSRQLTAMRDLQIEQRVLSEHLRYYR